MNNQYKLTIRACFTGYIVQAIINNFLPLLFLTFQRLYGIPLSQITILITVNFAIQLLVDMLSIFFVDKIGYRMSMLLAHGFATVGMILLTFLPEALGNPFMGLLIAVCFYAVGGGLLEVVVSPIVEACPSDQKEQNMSLLHSFYCWGSVGVIALSTMYFTCFGTGSWKILALLWALIPLTNGILFLKVPIATLLAEGETELSVVQLLHNKLFWLFLLLMVCAGASEQAVSQWASTFAEKGLRVSKTIGDMAGPCMFSILMGTSRAIFGKFGSRINLERMMFASGLLCILSYLMIGLTASPVWGLLGVALCGFSVGILWPGTFSKASEAIKGGGTAMFAMLALAGDLGCSGGPTFVGMMASRFGDDIKTGILAAVGIPIVLLLGLILLKINRIRQN
ncbi:MAG TPA: MFS transporter [Lachnospiraceae bacterium]|nr:MFS transporter [Lachnospiraceae bacterium]